MEETHTSDSRTSTASILADGGNVAAGAATAQAEAAIAKARGRGRPRNDANDVRADKAPKRTVAAAQAEMQKALEALYTPENFKGIVKAPADLMLAITGDSLWNLPDAEVATLATQSALAARYWMQADPKWVALTLFLFSVATTYGSRAMIHIRKNKDNKKDEG